MNPTYAMPSEMSNALAFVGYFCVFAILFLIFIFVMWLYFGIGTLTRLTDIKYIIEEIRDGTSKEKIKTEVNASDDKNEGESSSNKRKVVSVRLIYILLGLLIIFTAVNVYILFITR